MKDLKKLALILRALGITANVISDPVFTIYHQIIRYDNYCFCTKGMVHFEVWHDGELFEVHFTFGSTLVYDTLYLDSLIQVVNEITSTISKFEG